MAIKYCWATNRRGSSLKGVMELKEIGQNAVVCTTEKEPELCDGWLIPGRPSPQVSRHINKIQGLESGKQGHLQKYKRKLETK